MLKKMFKEKMKCIVYSFVKGKDIILGLNFDMLEKHVRKKMWFVTCHNWVRRKVNFTSTTT
jgi:hypothetical protein